MKKTTISVRLNEDKANKLDALAKELDRSKNYLINQALDRFFDEKEYYEKQLLESIEEAKEGKFISHEEVMASIKKRIKKFTSN